jgi:hypothetical protein
VSRQPVDNSLGRIGLADSFTDLLNVHEVAVIRVIGIGDIGRKGFKLRIVLLDREN